MNLKCMAPYIDLFGNCVITLKTIRGRCVGAILRLAYYYLDCSIICWTLGGGL